MLLGYTATWAGLILSPGAPDLHLTIPIVGKIMPYIQTRFVIAIGFLLLGGSLVYSPMNSDIDFKTLVLMRAAQGFGLAFLFVPISTIAYSTLPKEAERRCRCVVHHVPQYRGVDRHLGGYAFCD